MLACRSGFIEPPLMPAMVVEGLIALGFVVSVVALFTRKPWAWAVTVAAHLFCVGAADVLLALRLPANDTSPAPVFTVRQRPTATLASTERPQNRWSKRGNGWERRGPQRARSPLLADTVQLSGPATT